MRDERHGRTLLNRLGIWIFCLSVILGGGRVEAAESYLAVEAHTGKVLLELGADRKRPVASLAKIATAMVVLDWAELTKTSMATQVVVPPGASVLGGSNPMGLLPGDQLTLREALYSMLLGSDNIAAFTLAEHVGRSIQARSGGRSPQAGFLGEMNELAGSLGMTQTRFANAHGMDTARQRGYSTARDIARLSVYAMRNTGFRFYVKQAQRLIGFHRNGQRQAFRVSNTHPLVGRNGVNGIKSGYTSLAGLCGATSSERPSVVQKLQDGRTSLTNRRIIVVTLGSRNPWASTENLLNQAWPVYESWRLGGFRMGQPGELLNVPFL